MRIWKFEDVGEAVLWVLNLLIFNKKKEKIIAIEQAKKMGLVR